MLTLKAPTSIYYVPCVTGVFHSRCQMQCCGEFSFLRGSVLHFSVECTGGRRSEDFGQETYLPVRWWNRNHLPVYLNEELCMYLLLQDRRSELEKRRNMWCIATELDWGGFICLYISEKIQKFERKSKCTGQCEIVEDTRNEGNISKESFPL